MMKVGLLKNKYIYVKNVKVTQLKQKRIIGTPFKKGNPGRQKGSTNHLTRTVKETVLSVFNDIQSDPKVNLKKFARTYPREFYQIASRLIPTEITGTFKTVIKVTDTND